jgi:hypothetical protein
MGAPGKWVWRDLRIVALREESLFGYYAASSEPDRPERPGRIMLYVWGRPNQLPQ